MLNVESARQILNNEASYLQNPKPRNYIEPCLACKQLTTLLDAFHSSDTEIGRTWFAIAYLGEVTKTLRARCIAHIKEPLLRIIAWVESRSLVNRDLRCHIKNLVDNQPHSLIDEWGSLVYSRVAAYCATDT
jgi:hypothetical protein